MQSSPPQSASPGFRRPSAPEPAEYELDLNALGSSSIFSSPVAKPEPVQINSDDIDGPSDFTINMIDYLKGIRPFKREAREDTVLEPPADEPTVLEERQKPSHLQPTVEDYQSSLSHARSPLRERKTRPSTLRRSTVPSAHTSQESVIHRPPPPTPQPRFRSTTGRSSIASPLQSNGGASQYLMTQIERLGTELAVEREARLADRAAHEAEIAAYSSKLQAASNTIQAMQESHATELQRIRAEHDEKLHAASQTTATLQKQHAAEIQRLRTEHAASVRAATKSATELQTSTAAELQRLIASQQSASEASAATAAALRSAHAAEIQSLRKQYEEEAAANDAAITEGIRARESRWKEKLSTANKHLEVRTQELAVAQTVTAEQDLEIEALRKRALKVEKLNKAMGKQLMRAWGREECGDTGEMQEYRYKFVKA